jgi:hypothetical protein
VHLRQSRGIISCSFFANFVVLFKLHIVHAKVVSFDDFGNADALDEVLA